MGIALVGSEGTVATAAAASITPTIPQSTTAGNFLQAWVTNIANVAPGAITTSSAGWTRAVHLEFGSSASALFYKENIGSGEANPTFTSSGAGSAMTAKVDEFSGVATASSIDQSGSAHGTTSALSIAAALADAGSGDLVSCAVAIRYSVSGTKTFTDSLNNGATATGNSNDGGTNSTKHYNFTSWGTTTGNASADTNSFSFTTTNIGECVGVIASFKPAGGTQHNQALSVATSSVPAVIKQVGKVLSVATATVPSLVAGKVTLVTLATATATSPQLVTLKTLAPVGTGSAGGYVPRWAIERWLEHQRWLVDREAYEDLLLVLLITGAITEEQYGAFLAA